MSLSEHTLKLVLDQRFKDIIWRVETDEARNQIAIETRNVENRQVCFSVFDYTTGHCFIRDLSVGPDSWWNMDRLHQDTLFLHGYLSDKSPEHKGILALDIQSGKIKWQNFQLALEDVSGQELIVYNPLLTPKRLQVISAATGETIDNSVAGLVSPPRNILLPEIVNDLPPVPESLQLAGPVFYLHCNQKDCWSFHSQTSGGYDQHLIVAEDGTPVMSDILASGIQKFNPEAFFIQQGQLFYIRDTNREIVSYIL